MTTVALIIIAGGKRAKLIDEQILPSAQSQDFDEIIVVGDHHACPPGSADYRYLSVPAITHTTIDALIKRDIGTLASSADVLWYLCDDHALMPGALERFREEDEVFDAFCPSRWGNHPERGLIQLNMGIQEGYIGGHAGIFRRSVVKMHPWTTMPHHRNWDLLSSRIHKANGVVYCYVPHIRILDLEPEREPWN